MPVNKYMDQETKMTEDNIGTGYSALEIAVSVEKKMLLGYIGQNLDIVIAIFEKINN